MTSILNPEFWLSLAFVIVVGMILFSPIRHFILGFFNRQRQSILNQITQADTVLDEAKNLLKETQKNAPLKANTRQLNQQIKSVQDEFLEKTKTQVDAKKQDFQIRQKMMSNHIKNHLRTELLNQAEKKILEKVSHPLLDKDFSHLLKLIKEHQDIIKNSFVNHKNT